MAKAVPCERLDGRNQGVPARVGAPDPCECRGRKTGPVAIRGPRIKAGDITPNLP